MGWFNKEDLKSQYGKTIRALSEELGAEFSAGFTYGNEEYAGSWQGKNWKDDIENFAKKLQKYDRISFIADSKNFGICLGKLDAMLSTDLVYDILEDDKGAEILIDVIDGLKSLKNFSVKVLKNKVDKIKRKELSEKGMKNFNSLSISIQRNS